MSKKTSIQKSLFENVEDKIKYSTSSVEELRVPIYAPVKQLPWGSVEIRNRLLTQTHKDIMDLIFTYNKKMFRQKLDEIADCRIQYKDNSGNEIDFRVILKKAFSAKENLYGIVLDSNYVEFYEKGLSINYSSKIPELIPVDSPLVKSIIRFFFTHKAINLSLENILMTVGFPLPASVRTLQTAKKTLREHVEVFKKFDIRYDPKKEIFYYSGTTEVYINMPIENKTGKLPEFDN